MRTKLETFFLEELHRLLKLSMDERDGWCQDRVYEILCRAYQQVSEPKPPMTETQKQAAAQSMSAALGATTWGQQYGWPSPQLREAMSGSAQSRSNFKECVLTDPTLGISCRITFSEGKK